MVQLSHLYMATRKTIALTIQTLISKGMSLLFNTLSRFAIHFLLRSKGLLSSWLQRQFAVIWEPKKIKSVTVSIFSPSICHEVMGLDLYFTNEQISLERVTASYHRTRNWFQGFCVKFWALSDSITTFPSFKTLHTSLSVMSHILFFVREDFFCATTSQGY